MPRLMKRSGCSSGSSTTSWGSQGRVGSSMRGWSMWLVASSKVAWNGHGSTRSVQVQAHEQMVQMPSALAGA